jgi:hypothetical protein
MQVIINGLKETNMSFMADFDKSLNFVNQRADSLFQKPMSNAYVQAVLWLVLILYGGLAAPHLPTPLLKLFDWVPFRLFFLSLIGWSADVDPVSSILLAVIFYVGVNTLNGKKPFEKFGVHEERKA